MLHTSLIMPPKKPVEASEPAGSLEALTASVKVMAASVEAMREQLTTSSTTINNLSTRLAHIETILNATQAENAVLKKELANGALESDQLKAKLNSLEQHHRSWSVRVTGLKIPAEDECDSNKVKIHLYEQFLRPILEGAVSKNILPTLPTACPIIERAHVLPAKDKAVKPVIARFYCRDMRALIFKLKKEFAPRDQAGATTRTGGGGSGAGGATGEVRYKPLGRLRYQIYDDLTRFNFQKMKAIGNDRRVDQCWSTNGQLKFKLAGSDMVKTVKSVYDPIDTIVG